MSRDADDPHAFPTKVPVFFTYFHYNTNNVLQQSKPAKGFSTDIFAHTHKGNGPQNGSRLRIFSCNIQIKSYPHYARISSMSLRSSSLKVVLPIMPILSRIWEGLEAPINTLVISPSLRIHARAICARLCPRSFAI